MASSLTPYRKPREWGDGAHDRRQHLIADISYPLDTIACLCGEFIHGIRDGSAWQNHGGSLFSMEQERGEPEVAPGNERGFRAVELLRAFGRDCTCDTTTVADCPNYIPGDELEQDNDEED